jgi:hypothetical protein
MSFDLVAWKAPVVKDEDEARDIIRRFDAAGNPGVFEPSEDLLRFSDELLARYPALEALEDDDERLKRTPWSVTPERSNRWPCSGSPSGSHGERSSSSRELAWSWRMLSARSELPRLLKGSLLARLSIHWR